MTPGCLAAVEVGDLLHIHSDEPVVIQETNNTVVWLRPHPVIAKVGTRIDRVEGLVREHQVATSLGALGAPVAEPLGGSGPIRSPSSGFVVTLWRRLERDPAAQVSGAMVGHSLRQVHEALAALGTSPRLPDFRLWLLHARDALSDDDRMSALAEGDAAFLRDAFDALLAQLADRAFARRRLHGGPHDGNYLRTPAGIRWVDLECVCWGPIEWDLAFLADDVQKSFTDVDHELLALLTALNSARVATWCWIQAQLPEMRWHGEHHLSVVRANWRVSR